MPHSDSLILGIKLLREVLPATPIGYANTILSTALIIVDAVHSNKDIDNDFQHLARRVVELSMACSESMSRSNESESRDIQLYAGNFINSLESIANTVRKAPPRGFIGRITGRLSKAKTFRDLEEKLEHSSALLSLQLQIKNQKMTKTLEADRIRLQVEVQDAIAITQKEQLDLIRSRMTKAAEKRQKESTFSHYPPPPPQHFFGREDQVQHLVDSFQTVPSYQVMLGPGGIGKTCLSLRVFHDPCTVAIYGRHRYFLSCESIQDADGLTAGLASIFDLQEKNIVSQLKRVCSIIGTSIIFLLDNFETPWEQSDSRERVEAILSDLTSIPNLSLLITLRGGERPSGVAWTPPLFPILTPISFDASKRLFLSIADVQGSDPCLEKLVGAVEGLPLAVTLLASQAQSSDCGLLLSAWEAQKTSMVTRGFSGRLSCLDTSISLSIVSSRMKTVSSALAALQVLSLLPDGATTDELARMNPGLENTAFGAITLCQVSLAYVTDNQRLRVLSPIREYVRSNYPPDLKLLEHILNYHGKLSQYAAEHEVTPHWNTMIERLAPCIGNIHSVIYEALGHESLVFRGIEAAVAVAAFHRCAFVGSAGSLLKSCLGQAQRLEFRKLEADCYLALAGTFAPTHPEFGRCSAAAASIYRERGINNYLVKALYLSANHAFSTYQPNLAECNLSEAAGILSDDSSPDDRIEVLVQTGLQFGRKPDYSAAQKSFDDAVLLVDHRRNPWTARMLYGSLCSHYVQFDMYNAAIEAGMSALAVPGLHDHWSNVIVLYTVGVAYFWQGRSREAEEATNRAFEVALRYGRETHMAYIKVYLADFALANQRLDEAESNLQAAWVLWQSTNDGVLRLRLISLLGLLELFRNNTTTADAHLEEAKRSRKDCGDTVLNLFPMFYLVPKAYLLSRIGMTEDSMIYSICSIVRTRDIAQDTETAASLLVLGDAYILEEAPDTITARSCYEVAWGVLRKLCHRRFLAHTLVRLAAADLLEGLSERATGRFTEVRDHYREMGHYPAERFCLDQLTRIEANEKMDVASVLALPYPL